MNILNVFKAIVACVQEKTVPAAWTGPEQKQPNKSRIWAALPGYERPPQSTMRDMFQWRKAEADELDFSHHRQKTEFAEYTEVAARFMNQLITDKATDKNKSIK